MRMVGELWRAAARAPYRRGDSMVSRGLERGNKGAIDVMSSPALDHSTRLIELSFCDGSAPVKATCR